MFERIIQRIENAEKVGIFSHINPDGDAMGSSYSLKLALEKLGKKAEVFLLPNPDRGAEGIILGKESANIKLDTRIYKLNSGNLAGLCIRIIEPKLKGSTIILKLVKYM